MKIHVTTNVDALTTRIRSFSDGTGWHIDDSGRLHITKTGNGNIATFHAGAWISVEREEDAK